MLIDHLFKTPTVTESAYGAAAGVETIRQLVHAVKNSADIDLKVGPEMFPVSYGDARYLLQYWKANREGGDATAEYFGDANWIEAKLAKRDHTMSPDRLKDMDQERMKSKEYDRMVGIEEYKIAPTSINDYKEKMKALIDLQTKPGIDHKAITARQVQLRAELKKLMGKTTRVGKHELYDNGTNEAVQVSEETEYQLWWNGEEIDSFASKEEAVAMQKEYEMAYKGGVSIKKAKVKESFFDPHEKKIPSPTSDNPVTKRVEEDDESPRKMYHKHFVKAMKAMPGSQVQKRHQLEMEKYKKMMGKSFIDQVAPKEFAKFDRKVEEGYPTDYKGWKYDIEYIEDEDNRKKLHSATKDGKRVSIDWSPYSNMTDEQFKLWIDLGMPGRRAVDSIGPLDIKDLLKLAQGNKNVTHSLLQREGVQEADKEDGIDTSKLDAKTKIAMKRAGLKYGAQTKGDPIAALVQFVAGQDSDKSQEIDRLDKENDAEEADIRAQANVDKEHDTAIGNNALKDRFQDQELEKLKKDLQKILAR
jgi:hypothetical protein